VFCDENAPLSSESSHLSHSLKHEEVDWAQSRIIFISPEFTKYQGIQLWEVHKYSSRGLLVLNEVKSPSTKEPITAIAKNKVKEMYSELKSNILTIGKDIEVRPKKQSAAFRRKQAFVRLWAR
jgi:Domain of unknown function (DUF5655)